MRVSASQRSSGLKILSTEVVWIASMMWMWMWMCLGQAGRSLTSYCAWACNSALLTWAPGRKFKMHTGNSPVYVSGMPTAAATATAGCSVIASSIITGSMLWPLRVIRVLLRPSMWKRPCSSV
ncbi:MAG: hypothetical protein ACI90C_001156 [Rhodoferax sp.]|jgi:hypothetical protein